MANNADVSAVAQLRAAAAQIDDPAARSLLDAAAAALAAALGAISAAHVAGLAEGARRATERSAAILTAPLASVPAHVALAQHLAFASNVPLAAALHLMVCADVSASGGVRGSQTWRNLDRPGGPPRPGRSYLDS